ncbi:MAG: SGNH/GDSL hydrolase family protein [Myxococcales bacterium]|nr:SGNH/GDSL hydrolase family protein [Myxococcales bacterium]
MRLASGLSLVRTAWLLAGATLACTALLESCASLALRAGLVRTSFDRARFDERVLFDSDPPPVWFASYRNELSRAWKTRWEPYVYWVTRPFEGELIRIDERGIRRTWSPPPKSASQPPLRVFFFGGSTAWGRGARDDYTIPSLVAKELARRGGPPVRVVNFGQSGWVSTQERIALALELRRGDIPDVAVFYDGVNDVFAAYQSGVAGIPQNEIKRQIDFERFELGLLARVADRSSIVRILRRIGRRDPLSPPSTRTAAERTALARAVVDDYAGNIRIVEALVNRFDFDALHFWQPVVWSKARPTRVESEIRSAFSPLEPLYQAVYDEVTGRPDLDRLAAFHDVRDALDDEVGTSFFDYCHVGEEANAAIAARITPLVARALDERLAARVAGNPPLD